MLLSSAEMKSAEAAAFAAGVTAEALMEEAGAGIADVVRQFHPTPGTCHVFFGKGNNGGDALVAARYLARLGWQIVLEPAFQESALSPLPLKKLHELRRESPRTSGTFHGPKVVLDGLLGLGSSGEPRPPVASAIACINDLRATAGAWVLAMDMPSGLDADSGLPANECVEADATATLGFAKIGLLADSATRFVGRLAVVPLPALTAPRADPARVAETSWLPSVFPPRSFDLHKGNCGRIGLVVGSPGFTGAAHLASLGALHAGGGLITVFADPHISECLATRCPAEVMVRPIADLRGVLQEKLDVLAIGPGLGLSKKNQILTILRNARIPVVVDADALNALSENPGLIKNAPAPRLLTPHPGEMQRLLPQQKLTRREWACTLSEALQCTVLLKGARTVIASPKEPPIFNTTGNPGMAGGGMGDVLTGVCAALIGQSPKQPLHHLAALGAWLCGCAAEQALLLKDCSPESLKATDVATQLGSAFRALRQRTY